jgi:hypothetical protein
MKKRGYQKRLNPKGTKDMADRWNDDERWVVVNTNTGKAMRRFKSKKQAEAYKGDLRTPKSHTIVGPTNATNASLKRNIYNSTKKTNTSEFNKAQNELSKVERFVRKSDDFGDVIDWNWNGDLLSIRTMSGVERYSRKQLKEARVFNRERTRLFDGKEYTNDGFTYGNNKADVERVANRIRNMGKNARIVKNKNGYSIYERPKDKKINAIVMLSPDGSVYSATPYSTQQQKEMAIRNAKAFKQRTTGAYGGQTLAIMDGTVKEDQNGNWMGVKTRGRPYNFATPNMMVGMNTKPAKRRRRKFR